MQGDGVASRISVGGARGELWRMEWIGRTSLGELWQGWNGLEGPVWVCDVQPSPSQKWRLD